jgi:hypothetical protein
VGILNISVPSISFYRENFVGMQVCGLYDEDGFENGRKKSLLDVCDYIQR